MNKLNVSVDVMLSQHYQTMSDVQTPLDVLKNMHTLTIKYHHRLLEMIESLDKTEYTALCREFGYDMTETFNVQQIQYRIRHSTDRLYHIECVKTATTAESEPCDHEIVEDYIDTDPEKSQRVAYCKLCEKTFP